MSTQPNSRSALALAVVLLVASPALAGAAGGLPEGGSSSEEDWDDVVEEEGQWDDAVEEEEGQWDDAVEEEEGQWDDVVAGETPSGRRQAAGADSGGHDFSARSFIEQNLRWEGYYENQVMIFTLPGYDRHPDGWGVDLLDYNKLRLDLRAKPVQGFAVDADIVVRTYHGSKRYDLANILAKSFAEQLVAMETLAPGSTTYTMQDEIYLDNAFITANFWRMRLKVGKQQIRFGSGWMWNPIDPFNAKDMLDPAYEKRGVTAARLQLFLPHEGLLEVYALPRDLDRHFRLQDTATAVRGRIAIGRWMLAALYASFVEDFGVESPASFTPLERRRHLGGLVASGEIAGVGVWGELAFNDVDLGELDPAAVLVGDAQCPFDDGGECWFEALAGINYTFEGGTMVQAEYLYNGRGYRMSNSYSLLDWFAYFDQRLRYLGQHYATAMVQVPIETLHATFSLAAIANLSDGSLVVNPWLEWQWTQYLSLSVYGAITWGDDQRDEFFAVGRAAYARLRFSF